MGSRRTPPAATQASSEGCAARVWAERRAVCRVWRWVDQVRSSGGGEGDGDSGVGESGEGGWEEWGEGSGGKAR